MGRDFSKKRQALSRGGLAVLTKNDKKEEIHLEPQRLTMLPRLSVLVIPNSKMGDTRKNKTPTLFSDGGPILRCCLLLLVIPNPGFEV